LATAAVAGAGAWSPSSATVVGGVAWASSAMVVRNAGGERAARASLELESPGGGAEATRWGEGGSVAAAAAGSLLDAERDRGRVCSGVGERPEGQVQVSQVEVGSMGQPLWGRRKLYGPVWHSSTSPVELFLENNSMSNFMSGGESHVLAASPCA
jgi:hypothetical protein